MEQVLVFCRTNFDCDNLEAFLVAASGGKRGRLGAESGKENAYSCCVLAGARSMDERRRNLQGASPPPLRLAAPSTRADVLSVFLAPQRSRRAACAC
jgi:hypothetical protein